MVYIKQLTRQHFKQKFPTFTVSTKKAFLTRSSNLDQKKLLTKSGFTRLKQHISQTIKNNTTQIKKLNSTLHITHNILNADRERAESRIAHGKLEEQVFLLVASEIGGVPPEVLPAPSPHSLFELVDKPSQAKRFETAQGAHVGSEKTRRGDVARQTVRGLPPGYA